MEQFLPQRRKISWPDNVYYFLTSTTFLHYPYFKTDEQKQVVLNKIKQIQQILHVPISSFSIAINHFHLKFYLEKGELLTKVKTVLHSGISRDYRKIYNVKYKEFWQSTRTLYIRDEKMSLGVTGYIIGNLLKHKEVNTFEELKNNPFSSYRFTAEMLGEEAAKELVYSVINVNENAEGEVDLETLKKTKANIKPPPRAA